MRLGFETIGEEYFSSLLSCTKIPQFMGILGGKPRKAFFFVGAHHKSQQLIFLDPHMVQTHVSDLDGANKHYYLSNKHKYHSIDSSARMVHLSKLDPCMSLAYLVKNRNDFLDFKQRIYAAQQPDHNIFNVFETLEDFQKDMDAHSIRSYSTLKPLNQTNEF